LSRAIFSVAGANLDRKRNQRFSCAGRGNSYADGDQSIEGAAPRPVRTASQSKNKLAKGGGPMHLYRSSEGKIEQKAAQPAQRKKSF
jgi:hypothetical protein